MRSNASGKDVRIWDIHLTATALRTAAPRLTRAKLIKYERRIHKCYMVYPEPIIMAVMSARSVTIGKGMRNCTAMVPIR